MDAFHTTVEEFASEGSSASRDGDQIASASVGAPFNCTGLLALAELIELIN